MVSVVNVSHLFAGLRLCIVPSIFVFLNDVISPLSVSQSPAAGSGKGETVGLHECTLAASNPFSKSLAYCWRLLG